MVGLFSYRIKELCGNLIAIPCGGLECLSQHPFRLASAILICRIEERDARVQGGVYTANCLLPLNTSGHGQPRSKAQFRDFQRAGSQSPLLHGFHFCAEPSILGLRAQRFSCGSDGQPTVSSRLLLPSERKHRRRMHCLTRYELSGGKVLLVRRIGKVLRFQTKPAAHPIRDSGGADH